MSVIYEMLETFCIPDEKVKQIYKRYLIEKVYMNHVLTDTDRTCLQFLFLSDPKSDIFEQKYREIISEIIVASEIYSRFSFSRQYCDLLNSRQENLRKCFGYFEIENADNLCILTIAYNPKEYFILFKNSKINKMPKGIKKDSSGMNFKIIPQG